MDGMTGIMIEEKYRLRKVLWEMTDWLKCRGLITSNEYQESMRLFDCLQWSDKGVERFLGRIKIKNREGKNERTNRGQGI